MNNTIYNNYRRVSKATAARLYKAGKSIEIIPVNLRPDNMYMPAFTLNRSMREQFVIDDTGIINDFNNMLNSIAYYNCNNECGRYLAYYIKEAR